MANQKLSPRQRMINMMYLVLIAMLALNVSREILKSFHLFEMSYNESNSEMDAKNSATLKGFTDKMENEKTKARTEEWYLLAKEASSISSEFNTYIEKIKKDIINKAGGREEETAGKNELPELKKPDDMETHVYYFSEEGMANGKKLQDRINATRERLTDLVLKARNGKYIKEALVKSSSLKAIDPPAINTDKKNWSFSYLENAPLAGVVTLLTKTQNDCKNLEAEVLNVLSENINIESITNNGQMALIMPDNQSVLSGDVFRARVALATYDTRSGAQMYVNGKPIPVKDGVGEIVIPASGTGSHELKAQIESIDPKTGQPTMINSAPVVWNSYQASATISADNMNVLFIGLDNPMSISVPGITPANTIVSSDQGIQIKNTGNGKFSARVSGKECERKVYVSARLPDGSLKKMGEMSYRIRKVPQPKLSIGKLDPGTYEASLLKLQPYIYVYLENFYFKDVKFTLKSCHVTLVSKRSINTPEKRLSGPSMSQLQSILATGRSGDLMYMDEIVAVGPSGEVRLDPVTFKIK